jgi:predicted nucleic acid-binding Zn ribbon protein
VTRRRKSEPTPIGATIPRVFEDLGLGAASSAMALQQRWADIVGPEVAAHAVPAVLRGHTLDVTVDTSAWCQELQLRTDELLARLGAELGPDAPRMLRFRVGR